MKSTWRGLKKGEKFPSHEHDKDETVQHKNEKKHSPRLHLQLRRIQVTQNSQMTLLLLRKRKVLMIEKIAIMKKNDEEKEAEFSDDTLPFDKEEGASDRKDDKNKKMMKKKGQNAQMTLPLLIWRIV